MEKRFTYPACHPACRLRLLLSINRWEYCKQSFSYAYADADALYYPYALTHTYASYKNGISDCHGES